MADDDYEECDFSGLAKIYCAHCLGHKLGDEKPEPRKYGNLDVESEDPEDIYEVIGRRSRPSTRATARSTTTTRSKWDLASRASSARTTP